MNRKFVFKEESPDHFVIKIWDKTLSESSILLLFTFPICIILLIISYFFYAQLDSLLYPFFLGLGVVALAYFQISFFLKALLPSSQFVRIDLRTGIVNGVTNDSVGGKDVSWKFELNKVVAIQITWDDQPGALAILEILKSNHSRLHAFYGTHDEMRQLGAILEKSLHVACNDYTY